MPESLYEKEWTAAARKAHKAKGGYFAGPDDTFPLDDASDVPDAWNLAGHAADPDQVRANIKRWAKDNGHYSALPDTAKESVYAPSSLGKTKAATLTTTFLEDDAISLNGRQYPRATVDRLIQSAQLHLSTPGAAPLTCYISHEAADQDDSLKLAGKITSVWREGTKAKARIDLVNTEAGRTMATQAAGGFLRTMSLRASNAEIQRPKDATWPVVGGSPNLDGIDFTASPGIDVAKIEDVALAENAREGPRRLHEVFNAQSPLIEMEEKAAPMEKPKLNEAEQGGNTVGGYSATSGESPSMDGSPGQGAYGDRMFKKPDDTSGGPMQGMNKQGNPLELQEAHDQVAMVQGRSCAPSRESKEWRRALRSMTEAEQQGTVRLWQSLDAGRIREAGKALDAKNDAHLDKAHDALARVMNMDCEGASSKPKYAAQPADDGMQDGDDDDSDSQSAKPKGGLKEQQHKEQEEMPPTPEEMARALEAAGYKIEKPKTADEQLQERLTADKAEQEQKLAALQEQHTREMAELKAMIAGSQPNPERRSRVLGANVAENPAANARPLHGRYLQEQIRGLKWDQLADRTAPLPDAIPLDLLMKEFEHLYAVQYDLVFDPQGVKYRA